MGPTASLERFLVSCGWRIGIAREQAESNPYIFLACSPVSSPDGVMNGGSWLYPLFVLVWCAANWRRKFFWSLI